MNLPPNNSPKRRKLILIVSLIGIALMTAIAVLSIPVEYQLVAVLYANQSIKPVLETTVLLLIVAGVIALVAPDHGTTPTEKRN